MLHGCCCRSPLGAAIAPSHERGVAPLNQERERDGGTLTVVTNYRQPLGPGAYFNVTAHNQDRIRPAAPWRFRVSVDF